ncbi:hypothetical protein GCM10025872_23020 [Barrientosiimonas endolithica]|uniref:Uncharacterized protein n=1 Tax=Barrientosiimonas endolithica TaxID=1535208 RepID=A0ABN6YMP4_9MICO|nr:hypothetical protein GCM10025872_23020 [Barrientosiimonas endolithica]
MPEQLLHHAQVGPALEQVRRGAVPQPVGSEVGRVGHVGEQLVHDLAHLPRVDPAAAPAEEDRGLALPRHELGTSAHQPGLDRLGGGHAERDGALLVALAGDAHRALVAIEVVDVEADELADPDAAGVEQLEHRAVAQVHGVGVVGGDRRDVEQGGRLALAQHPGRCLLRRGASSRSDGSVST